jgi:hypothetical protein
MAADPLPDRAIPGRRRGARGCLVHVRRCLHGSG